MSIPKEEDPFALDDDGNASSSLREPESPWSLAANRALPSAASLLARPEPAKAAKAADAFRLEAPAPPPAVAGAPQAPGAAERAREAYERARAAAVQIEVEPFHAPPRIDPDKLDALKAVASEVVLESKLGTIALVPKTTGRLDRTELTFEDAATLRTLVDAFPGSRIISLTSAAQAEASRANDVHRDDPQFGDAPQVGFGEGAEASARSARAGAPSMSGRSYTGTRCSVCGDPQFETSAGPTCSNGHGGADPAGDAAEFDGDDNDHVFATESPDPSRTNTSEDEPDPFALD